MTWPVVLWPLLLAVHAAVPARPIPADLASLARQAGLRSPVVAWCHGELRPGDARSYAVALASSDHGGIYLVLGPESPVAELGTFEGGPELSCYSPAEARKVNRTIEQSETVHGLIVPRWETTVICGFTVDTTAVCWQYSPHRRRFVEVGRWVT